MLDIPCIIFAGGKSSRMGKDKALLPFGDSPTLTQYQLKKLQKIFKSVYISCKNKNKFNFKANFIEDITTENIYAPTTGFIACFEQLDYESFFVISVDTPFISENIIRTILNNDSRDENATVAILEGKVQPMCGIYHSSLKQSFKKMLSSDNHKLNYLLKNSQTNYVEFNDAPSFLNLNNPNDYTQALTLI